VKGLGDFEEVVRLQAGIREWLLRAARNGRHELRGVPAPAVLPLLCAAAFGPALAEATGLGGDAADLLVPIMFILWQATTEVPPDTEPFSVGIRVAGRNAMDNLVSIGPDGLSYAQEDVSGLPAVIEFDAGSLVLTAFGRVNAGTIRGDRAVADQFLNSFFRI